MKQARALQSRAAEVRGETPRGRLVVSARCLDRAVPRTRSSRARYLSWASDDPASTPSCTESGISRGLYSVYDDAAEVCSNAAAKWAEDAAQDPANAAFDSLARALSTHLPVIDEAAVYYDSERYATDACEGAVERHAKLLQGFDAILTAADDAEGAFDNAVERWNEVRIDAAGDDVQRDRLRLSTALDRLITMVERYGSGREFPEPASAALESAHELLSGVEDASLATLRTRLEAAAAFAANDELSRIDSRALVREAESWLEANAAESELYLPSID